MKNLYESMFVENERIKSLTDDVTKELWQQLDAKIDETMQKIWDNYPKNLWAKSIKEIQYYINQKYIIKINLNLPEELSDVSKEYKDNIYIFLKNLYAVGLNYEKPKKEKDKSVIGYIKFNLKEIMNYGALAEDLPSLTKWSKKFVERYTADINKDKALDIDLTSAKIDVLLDEIFNALSILMTRMVVFNSFSIGDRYIMIKDLEMYPEVAYEELPKVFADTPLEFEIIRSSERPHTAVIANSAKLMKFYYDMLQKAEYEQDDVPRKRQIPKNS